MAVVMGGIRGDRQQVRRRSETEANPYCHTKELTGEEVVWEGVIAGVDPFRLDMGTANLKATVNGIPTPAERVVFELAPEFTQLDKWKGGSKGSTGAVQYG